MILINTWCLLSKTCDGVCVGAALMPDDLISNFTTKCLSHVINLEMYNPTTSKAVQLNAQKNKTVMSLQIQFEKGGKSYKSSNFRVRNNLCFNLDNLSNPVQYCSFLRFHMFFFPTCPFWVQLLPTIFVPIHVFHPVSILLQFLPASCLNHVLIPPSILLESCSNSCSNLCESCSYSCFNPVSILFQF